jgi:hypothetical protein
LQPGATVEQVVAATGFELLVPGEVPVLAPPTTKEMATLRDLRGEVAPTDPVVKEQPQQPAQPEGVIPA